MTLKPEILCHPHIPKPLHGLSPRELNGKEWWDKTRQEVYKRYDFHCVACGVHKSNAKTHQWLEAHEFYDINNYTGISEIKSIEPLCHYCHNFIHSGRLSTIIGKEKSWDEVVDILEYGFLILSINNLKCFPFTLELAKKLKAETYGVEAYELAKNKDLKWTDYKLIFEGNEYHSRFHSYDEWFNFYNKG